MTVKELRERLVNFNDSDLVAVSRHSDFTSDIRLRVLILVQKMAYLERYFPEQYKVGEQPKTVQCLVID